MIWSEISEEQKWDELFSKKPDILAKFAASAMNKYQGYYKINEVQKNSYIPLVRLY